MRYLALLLCCGVLPMLLAACGPDAAPELGVVVEELPPDTIYTTVRQSPLYALVFSPSWPEDEAPPDTAYALAALHDEARRLRIRFTALQQSNEAFLRAMRVQGTGPLRELATSERTTERVRELLWQLRQEIDLADETQRLLARSNTYFLQTVPSADDSLRRTGLRMHQEIARLADIAGVLNGTRPVLHANGDDLPVDSLRMAGQRIMLETTRQGIVLAMLRRHGPFLAGMAQQDSSIVLQKLGSLISTGITLNGDVHTALRTSNRHMVDALGGNLTRYGWRLILAITLGIVAWFVIRSMVWLLENLAERQAARRLFYKKLIPIARLTVWGLAIYFILADIFKLDQRGLLAAATALGVAIGFAAQDILKNIFGGILIIFDQPFQVGDKINVGGTYGEVVSIGLRSTRIVTPDDNLVSVPNSQVVDSQVANANAGALDCQVVVDLYLPGWVDVRVAKRIAYSAAANSQYVFLGKPIVVNVQDVFKETFLTQLKVKAYVLDTRYEFAFASNVTETAKAEFLKHGLFGPSTQVPAPLEPANGTSATPSDPEAP